jgi:adenylate kinase
VTPVHLPARRVVFLGPPGAGKGTQAAELAREQGFPHLSTGDMLRAAVAEGNELGRAADGHMRAGRLVPDDLVLAIVRDRLARPDAAAGFVLDGFPRNLAQARALEGFAPLDLVLSFEIDPDRVVARLAGRRVCPTCGTVYHVDSRPPKRRNRCDRDGTELVQRPDDLPEAVEVRLKVYAEQTAPLLDYYRRLGLLREVDASGTPETVAARLRRLIAGAAPEAVSPSERL